MTDYDSLIPKLCPGYERALEEFSVRAKGADTILELGIGTGNIARAILAKNRSAGYIGIDVDEGMFAVAKRKLSGYDCVFRVEDFSAAQLRSVDAVVSSLSIHHLEHPEQRALLGRVYRAAPLFLHFELIAPEDPVQKREYDAFLEAHVRAVAADCKIDPDKILGLQAQGAVKDKPMKLSDHKEVFADLGAKLDIIFQEHCFVFYQSSRA